MSGLESSHDLLTADLSELLDVRHENPAVPMAREPKEVVDRHLSGASQSLGFVRSRAEPKPAIAKSNGPPDRFVKAKRTIQDAVAALSGFDPARAICPHFSSPFIADQHVESQRLVPSVGEDGLGTRAKGLAECCPEFTWLVDLTVIGAAMAAGMQISQFVGHIL